MNTHLTYLSIHWRIIKIHKNTSGTLKARDLMEEIGIFLEGIFNIRIMI